MGIPVSAIGRRPVKFVEIPRRQWLNPAVWRRSRKEDYNRDGLKPTGTRSDQANEGGRILPGRSFVCSFQPSFPLNHEGAGLNHPSPPETMEQPMNSEHKDGDFESSA